VTRALLLAAALAACTPSFHGYGSTTPARPPSLRGTPEEAFGEQVSVVDQGGAWYNGEAIACDARRLYLLLNVPPAGTHHTLWWRDVRHVRVGRAEGTPTFILWTVVGSVSTLSHGVALIFSLPVWLIAGIASAATAADPRPRVETCEALRPSTRFPQGIPRAFFEEHYLRAAPLRAAPPP